MFFTSLFMIDFFPYCALHVPPHLFERACVVNLMLHAILTPVLPDPIKSILASVHTYAQNHL